MKFEIRNSNSTTQPYYWRIVAANGNVLASSETYVNKADATSAAQSVIDNAADASLNDPRPRPARRNFGVTPPKYSGKRRWGTT